jgi:mannose-1-phosphate guanylyltransferase
MKQHKLSEPTVKAFLLVAGRGERLKPLTDSIPKCLVPINGQPLLGIWLEHLEESGIKDVLVNTHWLHEMVEEFVEKWAVSHANMRIRLFHEPALLGSGGTLLANRQWAGKGPFFIIYGDNLTKFDLRMMLAFHNQGGMPLTVRIYRGANPKCTAIVTVSDAGIITTFEEKPVEPKSDIGAGGIYVADWRIFDFFPGREKLSAQRVLDLSYHILPRMVGAMQAYESNEISLDIGTPESYETAQQQWHKILQHKKKLYIRNTDNIKKKF